MKLKLTFVLLVGVVLSYTACKKSGSSPAPTAKTANEQVASGQIAQNLAQSLAGVYGGASINDGIKAPALASAANSGRVINSLTTNAACGFFIDSTINVKFKSGDTSSTTTGDLEFHFKCDPITGLSTGYTIFDSLMTAGKVPGSTDTAIIVQKYTIEALNAANTKIQLDGSLKSWVDIDFTKKGTVPFSLHNKFVLTGLKIDLTKSPADITDGTATFVSDGSSSSGIFHYTGTITFLGNYKVKVVINGFVFHVDLTTGVVTPG
jgi:hypothetical protein